MHALRAPVVSPLNGRHDARLGLAHRLRSTPSRAHGTVQAPAPVLHLPVSPFLAEKIAEIEEPAALQLLERLHRVPVSVPEIRSNIPILTAVVGPTAEEEAAYPADCPAVVMLHSFDSSCLEFRRLYPLLAKHVPCYAVDLVGWGFTDHAWLQTAPENTVLGPESKRHHLKAFLEQHLHGKRKVILLGSSVGGAIAMDFALSQPQMLDKLVLLNPQVFIDGIGLLPMLPRFLAVLGVKLLGTFWLRNAAGLAAYYDREKFATRDAVNIARLHCFLPGWLEANLAFIQSGGYHISNRLKEVRVDTMVIWGNDDEILSKQFVHRVHTEMPYAKLVFIDKCGHVPHLENAGMVSQSVLQFAGTDTAH